MYLNLSEYKQTPKQYSLGVIFLFYSRGNPHKNDVLLIWNNQRYSYGYFFMHGFPCRLLVS